MKRSYLMVKVKAAVKGIVQVGADVTGGLSIFTHLHKPQNLPHLQLLHNHRLGLQAHFIIHLTAALSATGLNVEQKEKQELDQKVEQERKQEMCQ